MSKKFICTIPLQPPREGQAQRGLDKTKYLIHESCGFAFDGETRFPIIPVIYSNANPDDEIEVILIMFDYHETQLNRYYFQEELDEAQAAIGFTVKGGAPVEITTSGAEDNETQIKLFRNLTACLSDGDTLFMCVTFGQKPLTIIQFMTLNYAYKIRKNIEIGAVVYGRWNNSLVSKDPSVIYDVTSLFLLNDVISNLSNIKAPNAEELIDRILSDEK